MTAIKTALLSFGMSGEVFHGPLLRAHSGFDVTHILERTHQRSLKQFPAATIVRNIETIFNNNDIELIIVNTPNASHFDYAKAALEAGKHVVVEKPFSVTVEEADALIALAKVKGKVLTVFQNRRWDGDFLTVKKVVEGNLLGKIVEVETHYDRFRNYVEEGSWKEQRLEGTGILYNLGSHLLDQMIVLFGMPLSLDARMGIQRPQGQVDDYYDIRMQYKGFHTIIKSSYLVREQGPRYVLHGVEGSFVKYGIDPQEQALKDGLKPGSARWGHDEVSAWGKINTTTNGLHVEGKIETVAGDYLAFYENVYEAIRNGATLAVKPEESRDGIRLIEACFESNAQQRAVKL
ncbi:Gfo/Idh/MocA family oxidoreductase [Pseudochryseolinea flava]|uniref:Oxidoreductase n=1 Tax=Pseudochryseolinea flava TaxID=2059302 RepID=A0A364Y1S4_9BACT|nr:Gfo/Idh/MocA family oxidoreductase [Pseudochryseolinea flava]RAW00047.1 oxidoreductase [Pseudochryseolinea flava]